MTLLTRDQLAELHGCNPATVSRRKLPKVDGKHYDLADPEVKAFVLEKHLREALQRELAKEPRSIEEMGQDALEAEYTRENIEWKRRQSRKMDREHDEKMRDLIPRSLLEIYLGYIAIGVRNFLLPIGERVARGDAALRAKVDKETKQAAERILANADASLRKEAKELADALDAK